MHIGGGHAAVVGVDDAIATDSESDSVRVAIFGAIAYHNASICYILPSCRR